MSEKTITVEAGEYCSRLPYTVEGFDLSVRFLNMLKEELK